MTQNPLNSLLESNLGLPKTSGKVRDVYDLGGEFLIVSTDRISAFDWILPSGIPDKGRVLTQLSRFWFEHLDVEHHLLATELPDSLDVDPEMAADLRGRVMRVRKAEVIPFECVVRGYLEGSGWREYQENQAVCGIGLPAGLGQCARLQEPIFTPATKAAEGHDENVSFETMANEIGQELAGQLRDLSFSVYEQGCRHAGAHGIIIADTKFEFGWYEGRVILIDEVLTPDSSRFWAKQNYAPGSAQPSFDKQFVREWLMATDWDRNSPPPDLPPEVVSQTRAKYVEVFERLTGDEFAKVQG
ncbi:MAG: phosphoribosylaminoimidazolesuccinocarboxamide synthase [Aureliella sp.]